MDETKKAKAADASGILLLRFIAGFVAAWLLMLVQARLRKEIGFFGGNISYLTSLGVIAVIWLIAAMKRPSRTMIS